jgi:cobalt-zinc-cadmium efflux system protein
VDILMEATPKGLNVAQLVRDVVRVPGVADVHDLHVWSIAGGMNALSAHVQVAGDQRLSACDDLLGTLNGILANRYKITHTTIQFEYAGCNPHGGDELYCQGPNGATLGAHDHEDHDHSAQGHEHTSDRLDASAAIPGDEREEARG